MSEKRQTGKTNSMIATALKELREGTQEIGLVFSSVAESKRVEKLIKSLAPASLFSRIKFFTIDQVNAGKTLGMKLGAKLFFDHHVESAKDKVRSLWDRIKP